MPSAPPRPRPPGSSVAGHADAVPGSEAGDGQRSGPAVSVALVQAAARVEQDAEQQPSRVPHHLPGIHVLHAPGTELLEPGMGYLRISEFSETTDVDTASFARLNFATDTPTVTEILRRIGAALR